MEPHPREVSDTKGQQLLIFQLLTTLNRTMRRSYTWLWGSELPHSPLQMAKRVGGEGEHFNDSVYNKDIFLFFNHGKVALCYNCEL